MIYVKAEHLLENQQVIVHLVISTSCCKSHKFFREVSPGSYIDAETEQPVGPGWDKTINMYRRVYKREQIS